MVEIATYTHNHIFRLIIVRESFKKFQDWRSTRAAAGGGSGSPSLQQNDPVYWPLPGNVSVGYIVCCFRVQT